ncbi:DUF4440 domain-containing protein [Parasphingorhabdus cellanae]|uniref:Nuclear transport factor 2 family protein n=1 Tax=Parasphingorhabdus cellanae TaxID=2806553 RepID=A0ABX7T6T4_9SPHN|nr:DUF4440 domain-containing protein [Parasphingorhabdus cellanae]QTD55827.1 nuclear transport factor 2 family protein [Parasphingorhabdus cellanae]
MDKADTSASLKIVRETRKLSNAAIAKHRAKDACEYLTDEALIITSGATVISGREPMMEAFQSLFKRPGFVTLIRTPLQVVDGDNLLAETGFWSSQWQQPAPLISVTGSYTARWYEFGNDWRVQTEHFIPLKRELVG